MIYFAYGSNMLQARLSARVGDAGYIGPAHLPGHRLAFAKKSNDGSGKCTIVSGHLGAGVWGTVFDLSPEQKRKLDRFEGGGYVVETVSLSFGRKNLEAFTYIARRRQLDHSLRPYRWYKGLVLAGAAQAGLPEYYIAEIESVLAVEDEDLERSRIHWELIEGAENE